MPSTYSKCDLALVACAAESSYGVEKGNEMSLDPYYDEARATFVQNGYTITDTIAPRSSNGEGTSPLAALCLEPDDPEKPIIVSFRGTSTAGDVVSDMRIGVSGVVEQEFRDAAYNYYKNVREENPGREIIITGHSLGGSLAQYVAAKAYSQGNESADDPLLQVRTFNTAPVGTRYGAILDSRPELARQFVNYRLEPDVVSQLPLQQYYGNTFVFPSKKGVMDAHSIRALIDELPADVKNQTIGSDASRQTSSQQNALIELTNGALSSYQCRVDGQYFSRYRAGAANLAKLQQSLPAITDMMKNGDYDKAISQLTELKGTLDGNVSTGLVDKLIEGTKAVQAEQPTRTMAQEPAMTAPELSSTSSEPEMVVFRDDVAKPAPASVDELQMTASASGTQSTMDSVRNELELALMSPAEGKPAPASDELELDAPVTTRGFGGAS